MTSSLRYQGKPFLKLLECYVLWAMGELSESNVDALKEMTPKLRTIYGVEGDWQQVVSTVMELPPSMPALIRESWAKNAEIAKKNGVSLTAPQFAEMFVDQNLVS